MSENLITRIHSLLTYNSTEYFPIPSLKSSRGHRLFFTFFEALPVSLIRRAGLIQKLRILRSFSCNVKCDSVVCAADVGRQHSCLLRGFSRSAIFQFC